VGQKIREELCKKDYEVGSSYGLSLPSKTCDLEWKVAIMCWVAAAMEFVYVSLLRVHILVSISGVQQVTPRGQIFRWMPGGGWGQAGTVCGTGGAATPAAS
jgi:hypothetical protein